MSSISNIVDGNVICVSEIFFFVCFVVVLVGGGPDYATALRKSLPKLGECAIYALLIFNIIIKCLAEASSNYCKHGGIEVHICMGPLVGSQE